MKLSKKATANVLRNGWGIKLSHEMGLIENEIQRRSDGDPKVMKGAKPASCTFDAKRTLDKPRGLTQKKPHANRHRGRSGQEEVCTHPTLDGGQIMAMGT